MSSRYRRAEPPQIPQGQLPDYERASERLREANFDRAAGHYAGIHRPGSRARRLRLPQAKGGGAGDEDGSSGLRTDCERGPWST